jgi:5'-nucleotidase
MKSSPLKYFLLCSVLLFFITCTTAPKLKSIDKSMIELNAQNAPADTAFENKINPYKTELDKTMNEILVVSDVDLLKGLPESVLGNFVCDAVLKKANDAYKSGDSAKIDFCLLNNGGLRAQLPKGKISIGNVYEIMPFDNGLVVLTLSGEKTRQLFEYVVGSGGAPIAGARVKGKSKKIVELTIGGEKFDETKNYKVLTSDYLSSGGDKYNFFANPVKIETLNYLLRDAIIDYMKEENKKGNTIKTEKDGRVKLE